jgi:hypothetical protein
MWPFDQAAHAAGSAGVLALYLATLALHAAFIGYVVGGTAYALVRRDALAAQVRDRLPFMLGCGITAGVAPLLFLQLLHQHRFYTASLLLGPRWMAVVPALIAGFYALYLAKASERWRRPALGLALACWLFVAWSWTELHALMQADHVWLEFYAAGDRLFTSAMLPPRLIVLCAAMATSFATIAAWSADAGARSRLAVVALLARLVALGAAIWLWRAGFEPGPARGWVVVLAATVVVEAAAWGWLVRRPADGALAVATAAGTGALLAAVVVREAPRVALIEPAHELAADAGGLGVFVVALVAGSAVIAWIVRTVRA